jgi:hypothetical protein
LHFQNVNFAIFLFSAMQMQPLQQQSISLVEAARQGRTLQEVDRSLRLAIALIKRMKTE